MILAFCFVFIRHCLLLHCEKKGGEGEREGALYFDIMKRTGWNEMCPLTVGSPAPNICKDFRAESECG